MKGTEGVFEEHKFTIKIEHDDDGSLFAEVRELPGCFASGTDLNDLQDALAEAIGLYMSTAEHRALVQHMEPLEEKATASVELVPC